MITYKNNMYSDLLNIYNNIKYTYCNLIKSEICNLSDLVIKIIRNLRIGNHKRKNNSVDQYECISDNYIIKFKLNINMYSDYNYVMSLLYKYLVPELFNYISNKIQFENSIVNVIKSRYLYELILQKTIFYVKDNYLFIVFVKT